MQETPSSAKGGKADSGAGKAAARAAGEA